MVDVQSWAWILSFISEREITRPSICRLSVTFVHPTQATEIFRNIFTPFGTLAIYDLVEDTPILSAAEV